MIIKYLTLTIRQMEQFTPDKIILLAIFFVPGFVYLKAYRLFFAESKTDFSKDLYEAIGFSFIIAILFAYPLLIINQKEFINNNPLIYSLAMIFVVVVIPILGAKIYHIIVNEKWFNKKMVNPIKSPWDSFFSRRECFWVIVTLKNGRKIGGKYSIGSYASTFPNPKEIYLKEVWKLNERNGFVKIKNNSEGIIITENEISTIEFLK
jgi:hypothetical protein